MSIAVTQEFDEQIRYLYCDCGFDMAETGRRLFLSRSSVRRRLIVMKIELRSSHRAQPTLLPRNEIRKTIFMYERLGMTMEQIGEQLGISKESVRDRLRRANVPRRTKSEVMSLRHAQRRG